MLEIVHFNSESKQESAELLIIKLDWKFFEGVEGECKSLETRKKDQRLSQQEKVCIYAFLKFGKTDKSQVIQNYSISRGKRMNICSELNKEDHWVN